jgi:Domain of unknown function (DUF1990)
MKVFVRDQFPRLSTFLPACKSLPLSYDDPTRFREKDTTMVIHTASAVSSLLLYDFQFLFDYDIFPKPILRAYTEWQHHSREMQVGDVIVQQVSLPPCTMSLKCIFAVRILDIFRSVSKVGFSYGTLQGHAEKGLSTFFFALHGVKISATIHTFSLPDTLVGNLAAPVFTLPYQRYCTNQALAHMRARFLTSNAQRGTDSKEALP